MFCTNCGTKNEATAQFCPSCGMKIAPSTEAQPDNTVITPPPPNQTLHTPYQAPMQNQAGYTPQPQKTKNPLGTLLIVAGILWTIGVGIYCIIGYFDYVSVIENTRGSMFGFGGVIMDISGGDARDEVIMSLLRRWALMGVLPGIGGIVVGAVVKKQAF